MTETLKEKLARCETKKFTVGKETLNATKCVEYVIFFLLTLKCISAFILERNVKALEVAGRNVLKLTIVIVM